jgi:DNA primase
MDRPWTPILRKLTHRDVWGPSGIAPLEAFRRSASGYLARCPRHRPDLHPSFAMKEGRFDGYCFSCRYRVSWIDHVAGHLGITDRREAFRKAIEVLAARAGMSVPLSSSRPNAPDAFETAARWLRARLLENTAVAQHCRDYLLQRHTFPDVLELLPVGCLPDPDDAMRALRAAGCHVRDIAATGVTSRYLARTPLVFIYSDGDHVTGFKGRAPHSEQKRILNARGFGGERERRSLYCADLAREAIRKTKQAVLVEGEFDCLVWWSWTLSRGKAINWVALGGTSKPSAMTFTRLRELGAETVLLALDDDRPGHLATAAAIEFAWQAGLEPVVVEMPDGCKDPDDVFTRIGPETGLTTMTSRFRNASEWLVRHWLTLHPPETEGRPSRVLIEAQRVVTHASPAALVSIAAGIAVALGLEVTAVHADLVRFAQERHRQLALQQFHHWRRDVQSLEPQDLPNALTRGQAVLEALATLEAPGAKRTP